MTRIRSALGWTLAMFGVLLSWLLTSQMASAQVPPFDPPVEPIRRAAPAPLNTVVDHSTSAGTWLLVIAGTALLAASVALLCARLMTGRRHLAAV